MNMEKQNNKNLNKESLHFSGQCGMPFGPEEINILFEAARVALSDGETYDMLVDQLDLSDVSMKELQDKLERVMSEG